MYNLKKIKTLTLLDQEATTIVQNFHIFLPLFLVSALDLNNPDLSGDGHNVRQRQMEENTPDTGSSLS